MVPRTSFIVQGRYIEPSDHVVSACMRYLINVEWSARKISRDTVEVDAKVKSKATSAYYNIKMRTSLGLGNEVELLEPCQCVASRQEKWCWHQHAVACIGIAVLAKGSLPDEVRGVGARILSDEVKSSPEPMPQAAVGDPKGLLSFIDDVRRLAKLFEGVKEVVECLRA